MSVMLSPGGVHPGSPYSCPDYVFTIFFHCLPCTRHRATPAPHLIACLSPWCSSPRGERGWRGVGGAGATEDTVVGVVGVVECPFRLRSLLSHLLPGARPGQPSLTRGQGVSPCGPSRVCERGLILRTSRRPWSRVQPLTRRPRLHLLPSPSQRGRGW
jgi:hypothetical protein